MSGTPVENRLSEYWSIMDFAQGGHLGSLAHFTREFATLHPFREMGELLLRMLRQRRAPDEAGWRRPHALFLHGGVPRACRDEMIDRFQSEPAQRVFLLSLKAGGTGLNLTAANHVEHFDLWWNPAVEAQATDRAYRIGQQRQVQVHRFITRGTFEERINDMIRA